jgi:sugar lactone lactonase YvrE
MRIPSSLSRSLFYTAVSLVALTSQAQTNYTPTHIFSTLAGLSGVPGSADGTGSDARFRVPGGLVADRSGNVYVADLADHTIRKISPLGVVTTFAGKAGVAGNTDGQGGNARFSSPGNLAIDSVGNIYVSDTGNDFIRKITPSGQVSTVSAFTSPSGLAVDKRGNIYVVFTAIPRFFQISATGILTLFAGPVPYSGPADQNPFPFLMPYGLAIDQSDNLYVTDLSGCTIHKITPAGTVSLVAGKALLQGAADGFGPNARFRTSYGLAVDASGTVLVADSGNHTIRVITSAGVVSTLAGQPGVASSSDGMGAAVGFNGPRAVAVDQSGNIYVSDTNNYTIRKGQLPAAPTILTQPVSLAVNTGGNAQFSVTTNGAPAPTYQWFFNDQPFTGANNPTLSFTNVRTADAGSYHVVVTNSLGSVTSNRVTLTVTTPPTPPAPAPSTPAPSGGKGGGGGAPSVWFLVSLLALWATRRFAGQSR